MNLSKFEKAVLDDKMSFELSNFDDANSVRATYRIPPDQDVEKSGTDRIDRMFLNDLVKKSSEPR